MARALRYSEQRRKEATLGDYIDVHTHAKSQLAMCLYSFVKKVFRPVSAVVTCKLFISLALFAHLSCSVMAKLVLNALARSFIYFKVVFFSSGAVPAMFC